MDEQTATRESKILIVDDNPQNIQVAANQLKEEGVHIAFARSGSEALGAIEEERFDLLLLDVMMPEMDGFELCRRIKLLPLYRDVPIIFLTARDDKDSVLEGFGLGAVDYIAKPFFGPELISRVRTHLRLRRAIAELERSNIELNKEVLTAIETEHRMAGANRELREQATRDPLTGLANRRAITSLANYERDRLERTGETMSIVIGDIDRFKQVNDGFGHECGDHVLQQVAACLLGQVRRQDQVGRWGGEEFLILLPGTSLGGARVVSEKIRASVAERPLVCADHQISVTITFGVAECTQETTLDEAIRRADYALLEGKQAGRNRVVLAK